MLEKSKQNQELTILVLLAVIFGVLDSIIPKPIPFMKLGLANIASIITIVRFGLKKTVELNMLRVFAVALVTGLLVTPTFLLSLSGSLVSALSMGLIYKIKPSLFSIVGISIIGAVFSMWIQLLVASYILEGLSVNSFVLIVTVWAVLSGSVVGILAWKVLKKNIILRVLRIG